MSYNVSSLTVKVQQRVKDFNYSSDEILNYINDTQNDVFNEYRLTFMQTSQTYTATIGDPDITHAAGLPDDFVEAIDLYLSFPGAGAQQQMKLEYVTWQQLQESYPNPTAALYANNIPRLWYKFGSVIKTFPSPVAAYAYTLQYYKKPDELTGDTDTPEIPSEFSEILVVGPSYRILQIKDNYDQAAILENKYMELQEKMAARYALTQAGHATRMRVNRVMTNRAGR